MIKTEKLQIFMKQMEARNGRFTLFGLFLREDSPGLWDLVLAAPWLENGKLKTLGEFVQKMSEAFGQDEVISFSRIVTLNHDDPALRAILSETGSLKKPLEKQGHDLFGLPIEHAVILRAGRTKNRMMIFLPQNLWKSL
jgi:hypothetical protein